MTVTRGYCCIPRRRMGLEGEGCLVRSWKVCRMHGARGGAPEGERNGNYRHGARTKEASELRKLIRRLGGKSVMFGRMQASLCMGLTVILTCCPSEETLTMRAGALAFPQY
jgi:hypothetical protein